MTISKSNDHNENYLAKVVVVKGLRPHANPIANSLLMFDVDGRTITTSNKTPEGQISIYFPLECQLSHEYLSGNNDYRQKSGLNADPNHPGGYFEDHRRVKALKLLNEVSEGYVVPISTLATLIGDEYKELEQHIGESFDTINGHLLLKKYEKPSKGNANTPGAQKDRDRKLKKVSKLIEGQFKLHYSTNYLDVNLYKLFPWSFISLSWKWHGTSWVASNVLCNKPLKWWEKILLYLGVPIISTEYSNIYSSRTVVKNTDLNESGEHYYDATLYGEINEEVREYLHKGETLYGEAVGFTSTGKAIQKGYDYGCEPNEFKIVLYRVTHTNVDGITIDLPYELVQQRAEQLGIEAVPLIYHGTAAGLVPFVAVKGTEEEQLAAVEKWRGEFLTYVKDQFLKDQRSIFCKNKVPEEGFVLRIEGLKPVALKMINKAYKVKETKALDAGEEDMEAEQEEV